MNNHNFVIYEFDELYKILVEIKKDINLSFEKATKQKLPDLNSKTNCLVFESYTALTLLFTADISSNGVSEKKETR